MHILSLSAAKDLAKIIVRNKKDDMKKIAKKPQHHQQIHIHRFKKKSIITKSQRSDLNVYKQNVVSEMQHLIGELITN